MNKNKKIIIIIGIGILAAIIVLLFFSINFQKSSKTETQLPNFSSIEDVLKRNEAQLMTMPGVVGVGISESEGKPVISIMVKEFTPELKNKLPENLEGFDVKVEVVGEITPF